MKSSPHLLQLEKARVQQQRPNTAKNKFIYLFIYLFIYWKKKKEFHILVLNWSPVNLISENESTEVEFLDLHG